MTTSVRIYVSLVIASGLIVLALALREGLPEGSLPFVSFLALAVAASLIKLRLPGVEGVYSLGFFFILTGLCYFTLAETLAAACVSALAGTLFTREHRPTLVQVLFNTANLIIGVGVCHLMLSALQTIGLESHHPAVLAAVAFLYFVVNTVIVSGVLSLLGGQPLLGVCREWYFWSFPYYIVGVIVVGLLPLAGQSVQPAGWLAVLPPLYLLHFFFGLAKQKRSEDSSDDDAGTLWLPKPALAYIVAVISAGALILSWSLLNWDVEVWWKPLAFLAAAIPASVLKIRLPGVTGTVSLSFVVLLVAVAELSLLGVLFLAGVSAAAQSIWGSDYRPAPVQVVFNVGVMLTASGLAYGAAYWSQIALGQSVLVSLILAAAVLYFADTLLVATVLCLVEAKPLSQVWQGCYYWSFPYYLVGAGFAAVMSSASVSASGAISFLALPLMALVYLSYRLQLGAVHSGPSNG